MIAQAGVLTWPEWLALVGIGLAVFFAACYWLDERPRRRRMREWEAARERRRELRVCVPVGVTEDGVQVDRLVPVSDLPSWDWPEAA